MVDYKGKPFSVSILGDREHHFALPLNPEALPPKVAAALTALADARTNEQKVSKSKERRNPAVTEACDATRAALHHVYDTAAATSKASQQQYAEAFEYGGRRLARALGDAEAAVQQMVTAAQLRHMTTHGHGVGIDPAANTKVIAMLRIIAETIEQLPAAPAIDAE